MGGGGPPADDDRGCYDPVWPRLTQFLLSMLNKSMLNSMLPSFFFDVTRLQIFDVKSLSMLHFSMFPYSMLTPSITLVINWTTTKDEIHKTSWVIQMLRLLYAVGLVKLSNLTRHFWKCLISANPCHVYVSDVKKYKIITSFLRIIF